MNSKGVQAGYPFYGTLALQNGQPYSHSLTHGGALVRPELLAQLGVAVGDRILIGGRPFTIRGVIDQEPGRRVGGFRLGSRVLVISRTFSRRDCSLSAAGRLISSC